MVDLRVGFPVSGVETWVFLPPLVAFAVSFLASMGGVSGAFLLLPFQVSCLHFTTPSVSATNFVYNILAVPSGVYRYIREGRMSWPLAWVISAGTLPGVFFGYFLRVRFLPDPAAFRLFAGCVLLYVGSRLLLDAFAKRPLDKTQNSRFTCIPLKARVKTLSYSSKSVEYEFCGRRFSFGVPAMFTMAFVVGVIGGTYGIGGGSIIAPLCVSFFSLPVYTVAGAALLGTFLTSIAGVFFYSVIPASAGVSTLPDWPLGILFGLGGILGVYCGARLQRFVPPRIIKTLLGLMVLGLALSYIAGYFRI
ncbi:MAG: sulfite exporter TauE/SafE family protein [Acidobacteria bacterium]|nr:sulfite exporter TauE/SafE family protein [Acidobacteriota bacterium]